MTTIATRLPEPVKKPLRRLRDKARRVTSNVYGKYCPVCGKLSSQFGQFGYIPREDALCPNCNSLERHRFAWLYLTKRTDLFDGKPKKMLHIAPESCFESELKKRLGDGYLTADLHNPNVMEKMDITSIEYPDKSFDVVFCSHVLEHVQEDKKAMREFYRILKSTGWAILLVPITANQTFEDSSIVDPEERLKAFGQEDHVRRYGPDYVDRLREAGFQVKVSKVMDLVKKKDATRMALTGASGEIYHCTR